MRILAPLIGALTLSACGSGNEENLSVIRSLRDAIFNQGESGAAARPQFSRQAIEESGQDFILAGVPSRGALALLQQAGTNRGAETWVAEDGVSATYRNGILIATKGLGPDLMAADVSGTVAALRQGGGTAVRTHEYLDGNDQIIRYRYECAVQSAGSERITIYERSYDTVKYEESCESGLQRFTNTFWVGQDGVVWKSRQLISPPVGYLDSERL
ncbi:YjbF family lipoprotein [Histidinibacterium aquaticum]|nr:YjbF family lipoprotein [Histidinibacterium aquaticum]